MYCQNCGAQLPDSATYCDRCGNRVGEHSGGARGLDNQMASIMVNKKSEALALILSLIIPGLGQIYIGQSIRGILMFVMIFIIAILTMFFVLFGILYIVLWLYAMYDAFKGAKEYNRYLLEHNGQPPW